MSIKKSITENPLAIFIKMIPTMVDEFWRFAKGNARCGNSGNRDKMLTEILMLTHALEKGLCRFLL